MFQSFHIGAFHYLVKPFDDEKFTEVLLNAVKQFVERKKLEDAGRKREKARLMNHYETALTPIPGRLHNRGGVI